MKASKDIHTAAAVALKLTQSSIRDIGDLWSLEKIRFEVSPKPQTMDCAVLEEIVFRSFQKYLERPGHVLLPDGIISEQEVEEERHNSLLRVQRLWEYWHGSGTLDYEKYRTVSEYRFFHLTKILYLQYQVHIDVEKLERPKPRDPTLPPPMVISACFDRLEISINQSLLEIMQSHLHKREESGTEEVDTDFDCWIHGQIYRPEYNKM